MKRNRIMILAAGAFVQLFLGIIYVWSVFVSPVSAYFDMTQESAKLTSSFMLAFFVLGILMGGRLQGRMKTQHIVLLGGCLMAFGMTLTAFLPLDLGILIYITYGCMGGFGVGLAYNSVLTVAQKQFPDKRGLATGISVCMFGFSTVIFAPLVTSLVANKGIQNTFLILAVMFLIATLIGFSFIEMPEVSAAKVNLEGKQFSTSEMLKTKEFYYVAVSMMLGLSVYFILNPSFYSIGEERGLTTSQVTIMIMCTGVANALGRLLVPLLADKISAVKAAALAILVTIICTVLMIYIHGILLIVVVVGITFCFGGFSGVYPVLTGQCFGLENIGSNYGMVMVGFMISSLLFPILLGSVTDMMVKFVILAVVATVGLVLLLLLIHDQKHK